MTDDQQNLQDDQGTTSNPPDGTAQNPDKKTQDPVPYSRFSEVNTRMREAEQRLAEREAADRAAADAERLERGEHAKIIEELRLRDQRLTTLEAELAKQTALELEKITDEEAKAVVNAIPDVEKRLQAARYMTRVTTAPDPKSPPPNMDAGKGSRPDNAGLTALELEAAKAAGMTSQEYADYKVKYSSRS